MKTNRPKEKGKEKRNSMTTPTKQKGVCATSKPEMLFQIRPKSIQTKVLFHTVANLCKIVVSISDFSLTPIFCIVPISPLVLNHSKSSAKVSGFQKQLDHLPAAVHVKSAPMHVAAYQQSLERDGQQKEQDKALRNSHQDFMFTLLQPM